MASSFLGKGKTVTPTKVGVTSISNGAHQNTQIKDTSPEIEEFLSTLSPMEMKGYLIAKSQLNSTFNIEKSNVFLRWKKAKISPAN